jgi:hypothetical protein
LAAAATVQKKLCFTGSALCLASAVYVTLLWYDSSWFFVGSSDSKLRLALNLLFDTHYFNYLLPVTYFTTNCIDASYVSLHTNSHSSIDIESVTSDILGCRVDSKESDHTCNFLRLTKTS